MVNSPIRNASGKGAGVWEVGSRGATTHANKKQKAAF